MPNGDDSKILGPTGRPANQKPRIIQLRNADTPKPPPDKGIVTVVQRGTGAFIGKKFTEVGLIRLICRLIEDRDGLITIAAKDIEDLDGRALNFKYSRELDIFDIAVSKAGEPNPFDVIENDETEDQNQTQEGQEDND